VILPAVVCPDIENDSPGSDEIGAQVPGVSEQDDQFPLCRVLRCFTKAEGSDGKPVLRCRSDRVNRGLSAVKIFA